MSYDSYAEWALKGTAPAEVCSHAASVAAQPATCLLDSAAAVCGNGVMEPGEACDSGAGENETSPCCVGCQLAPGAQCDPYLLYTDGQGTIRRRRNDCCFEASDAERRCTAVASDVRFGQRET